MTTMPESGSQSVWAVPPIESVREGMLVIDSAGEHIGKVEAIRMGDPEAITTEGNVPAGQNFITEIVAEATGQEAVPGVPTTLRRELIRKGYIKIDAPGLEPFDHDWFAASDQIASVTGDTVRLSVPKDQVPREHED